VLRVGVPPIASTGVVRLDLDPSQHVSIDPAAVDKRDNYRSNAVSIRLKDGSTNEKGLTSSM
jgi:hypothetical protein